jgi:hypothetical protein
MQTFSFNVKMQVADSWVADGFQVKDRVEQIQDLIAGLLPYAYGYECVVKVVVTGSPSDKTIEQLQNGELEAKD